jgi:hypothetical protein
MCRRFDLFDDPVDAAGLFDVPPVDWPPAITSPRRNPSWRAG